MRVFTCAEHFCQIVACRVDFAGAHTFDKGRNCVEMFVARFVVLNESVLNGVLTDLAVIFVFESQNDFEISQRRDARRRPDALIRSSSASLSILVFGEIFERARVRISKMSKSPGWRVSTRLREISGLMISKLGFSVVAPISEIRPLSMCGKKASC